MHVEAAEDKAMMRYVCAAVAGAVLLTGCASDRYTYAPVTTSSAELEGVSAAVYGVPPDAPRGEVRVAMLGVGSAPAIGGQETSSRVVHVALAVSNRADEPWRVDPSEQRLTFTAKRERSDLYATGDASRAGPLVVAPRSTRVIDLYFALPIQLEKESSPPSFELRWTVHAGSRSITQVTPFQRFLVAAPTPAEDRELRRPIELDDDGPVQPTLPGREPHDRRPFLPFRDAPVE